MGATSKNINPQKHMEAVLSMLRDRIEGSGPTGENALDAALLSLLYGMYREGVFERMAPEWMADEGTFTKMFRQIDVATYLGVDMAVWHLLNHSQRFWKCWKAVMNEAEEATRQRFTRADRKVMARADKLIAELYSENTQED